MGNAASGADCGNFGGAGWVSLSMAFGVTFGEKFTCFREGMGLNLVYGIQVSVTPADVSSCFCRLLPSGFMV